MKVGKAIYNILSQSTDVQSNFPYNNTDYSPTGTELVENGEFDELGTDVITNGSFATDTDWTKGNGWSIAGKAISTQALGSEEVTNGDFSAAGSNLVDNPNFTDGTDQVLNGDFATDLANWNNKSSTSTWVSGSAVVDNSIGNLFSGLYQDIGLVSGKSYKLTATLKLNSGDSNGAFRVFTSTSVGSSQSAIFTGDTLIIGGASVTETFYFTHSGTNVSIQFACGSENAIFEVDNVSCEELGADWTEIGVDPDSASFVENGLKIVQSSDSGLDSRVFQTSVTQDDKSYKVTYTIHSISLTSGNSVKYYNGAAYVVLPEQGVGTHTFYYTRQGTLDNWIFNLATPVTSATDFVTISSLSVQELGEGWTLGTGWSIGEDKAISTLQSGSKYLTQSPIIESGKSYKVTFEVIDYTSGSVKATVSGDEGEARTGIGTYTETLNSTGTTFSIKNQSGLFIGSVSNVSVKEIATSYLTQAVSLSAKTWKIIYSVSDYIAGSVSATDYGAVTTANEVGITEYVEIGAVSDFRMVNIDGYFEGAVTGISAELVDPNGYWTLGTGWSFGEEVAISDGSVGFITQSILTADTSYKITVKVTGNPTLLVFSSTSFYGDEATRTLKNGTHTYYLQAKAATFSITNEGGDACTITNISVKEVVLNKIFPELAPPDIDAPYIVYSVVSNSPSETKNANGDIDTASIEVYGFQDTYNKAVDLGVSIRAALDRKTGTYNTIEIQSTNYVNEQMDVNEARKLWAAIQDYTIRIKNK